MLIGSKQIMIMFIVFFLIIVFTIGHVLFVEKIFTDIWQIQDLKYLVLDYIY